MTPDDWRDRARCKGVATSVFFPETETPTTIAKARAVCSGCPVRAECLREAMSYPWGSHGVWGGTTEHERKQMRRQPGWREAVGA